MVVFGMWLAAGVLIGMVLMAFLAIGTYQRGYEAGSLLRKPWQVELRARRDADIRAYARETKSAARKRVGSTSSPAVVSRPEAVTSGAAAAGG
jgi:hypothetical protein